MPKTRLFVGNLPYDRCNETDLTGLFAGWQIVDAKVVTDRETGRPRGFCFVELASDEDAKAAIAQLNGTMVDGRALVVNEANERPPRRIIEELVAAYRQDDPLLSALPYGAGLTNAEAFRLALIRRVEEDPHFELPRHWYSDRLGRILGLPVRDR